MEKGCTRANMSDAMACAVVWRSDDRTWCVTIVHIVDSPRSAKICQPLVPDAPLSLSLALTHMPYRHTYTQSHTRWIMLSYTVIYRVAHSSDQLFSISYEGELYVLVTSAKHPSQALDWNRPKFQCIFIWRSQLLPPASQSVCLKNDKLPEVKWHKDFDI